MTPGATRPSEPQPPPPPAQANEPWPSSYRVLEKPLPSHPGFSSRSRSAFDSATYATTGALSTLSVLLGPARAPAPATAGDQFEPNTHERQSGTEGTLYNNRSSLLTRRRGNAGADAFQLGPLSSLWRPAATSRARAKHSTRPLAQSDNLGTTSSQPHQSVIAETEDLPPSPVGLPGAWTHGHGETSGALLLPPPFLDDHSTAKSFEGVLGTRFARETSARARREARNYARDRPPPPAFPASLLHTASKLVNALGPPGGVDSGPMYRRWRDNPDDMTPGSIRKSQRQLERAERGMRGYELGERIAQKLAGKLRHEGRSLSFPPADVAEVQAEAIVNQVVKESIRDSIVAATPASILGVGVSPGSLWSPPLFAFPTPGVEETPPTSVDSPPFPAPPKPYLRPFLSQAEPSPLPSPLALATEWAADTNAYQSQSGTGDYFALRQRSRTQRRLSIRAASSEKLPASTMVADKGKSSQTLFTNKHGTPQRSLCSALQKLQAQVRAHFDLILWILIGDPDVSASLDETLGTVGGLLGLAVHLVGFVFFLVVHTWALFVSTALTLRSIVFFGHWTFLNLTGRTDLSIVVKDYYMLCRKEWDAVCAEDGVTLSAWSVLLGLLELTAVQAMSKERWLQDGPGRLVLLNGDEATPGCPSASIPAPPPKSPGLHARPMIARASGSERPKQRRLKSRSSFALADGADGESLLVTGGGDSILEGRILNDPFDQLTFSPRAFSPMTAAAAAVDDDDLPPLDIGTSLPGFSFQSSPTRITSNGSASASPPLRPIVVEEDPKADFFALLKRHVRLATASYGLHSYILAPPSPLFTPSVNHQTLPHRVFTHLSGVDNKTSSVLHVAIQKHYTGVPARVDEPEDTYEPQFYLLRDDLHGEVVCVVRGTQSLADIRTDLEAGFETVTLPPIDSAANSQDVYLAHAGILAAARRLLDQEHSPLFAKLRAALEETGYSLVFNGHSLGASIASMLALLVGQYHPHRNESLSPIPGPTSSTDSSGYWTTSEQSGLPAGRPVRAICFAHPTTTNLALAARCALGATPLVVSVSFGPDAVCRMGIPQVRELRRALGRLAMNRKKWIERVQERLRGASSSAAAASPSSSSEFGQKADSGNDDDARHSPIESRSTLTTVFGPKHGKSEILSAWWRWKQLGGGADVDSNTQVDSGQTPEAAERRSELRRIEERAWRWRREVDGDVGGPVAPDTDRHDEDGSSSASLMAIPAGKCFHVDRLPRELEARRVRAREEALRTKGRSAIDGHDAEDADEDEDDEDEEQPLYGIYSVERPSKFYSLPWLEADLVKCHLPKEYLDCLSAL